MKKYLQYLKNTGESVTPSQFDEDWEPIGPTVRRDLEKFGLVELDSQSGLLRVTAKGNDELDG